MRLTLADNPRFLLTLAVAALVALPALAQEQAAQPVDSSRMAVGDATDSGAAAADTAVATDGKTTVTRDYSTVNQKAVQPSGPVPSPDMVGSTAPLTRAPMPSGNNSLYDDEKLYDTARDTDPPHIQRPVRNGDTRTSQDESVDIGMPPAPNYAKDLGAPAQLNTLMQKKASEEDEDDKAEKRGRKMRLQAMSEAGTSYGARGGLARRTWEIRQQLSRHSTNLDQTFNFRQLLIAAPSGFLIEPPIVTESEQNTIVSDDGQEAAVADTMLRISREARIVQASRDWRTYLERDWGKVDAPPEVLLPKADNDEEQIVWAKAVASGWDEGYQQADEIFQSDLDRMSRDYVGMVRYRYLLAHNMISAPYALQEDHGVTGGGSELRIGDRNVAITGQSQLQARPENWQPIPR